MFCVFLNGSFLFVPFCVYFFFTSKVFVLRTLGTTLGYDGLVEVQPIVPKGRIVVVSWLITSQYRCDF